MVPEAAVIQFRADTTIHRECFFILMFFGSLLSSCSGAHSFVECPHVKQSVFHSMGYQSHLGRNTQECMHLIWEE